MGATWDTCVSRRGEVGSAAREVRLALVLVRIWLAPSLAVFNMRRWPRSANKLRYLLLHEVLASKRCSSVERTVPSAVPSDLLL